MDSWKIKEEENRLLKNQRIGESILHELIIGLNAYLVPMLNVVFQFSIQF